MFYVFLFKDKRQYAFFLDKKNHNLMKHVKLPMNHTGFFDKRPKNNDHKKPFLCKLKL